MIEIKHDDVPELEEDLLVQLYRVTPPEKQRLRAGADRVKITVQENDNPGGTFEFGDTMMEDYTLEVTKHRVFLSFGPL